MSSGSVSRRSALRAGAGAAAAGVTVVALPGAIAAASDGGTSGPSYGGYSAQQIANFVGYTFSILSSNRRLGFEWVTPDLDPVAYTSSVSGPFTGPTMPWNATASGGVVSLTTLTGWTDGETVTVSLTSSSPFVAVVSFEVTASGSSSVSSNWAVDGGAVDPPG